MSKAFTKEDNSAPEEELEAPEVFAGGKNYISAAGFARLQAELRELVEVERPEVVKTVAWAASRFTSTIATGEPSDARRIAVARPMPEPAPVTNAARPEWSKVTPAPTPSR